MTACELFCSHPHLVRNILDHGGQQQDAGRTEKMVDVCVRGRNCPRNIDRVLKKPNWDK
jgi:hypothetical protein